MQVHKQWKENECSRLENWPETSSTFPPAAALWFCYLMNFIVGLKNAKYPVFFFTCFDFVWNSLQRYCSELNVGSHRADPTQTPTISPNVRNLLTRETVIEWVNTKPIKGASGVKAVWMTAERISWQSRANPACGYNRYAAPKPPAEQKLWSLLETVANVFPLSLNSSLTISCDYMSLPPTAGLWLQHTRVSLGGQQLDHVTPVVFLHREGGACCTGTIEFNYICCSKK